MERLLYLLMRFLFVLLLTLAHSSADDPVNPELELLNSLFSDYRYSPQARPVANPADIITVNFTFLLGRIESLDEKTQVLTTFGYLNMVWYDHFLQWDPEKHRGISQLVVESHFVWMPEVVLLNSVDQGNDVSMDTRSRVIVHHTGLVQWLPGFRLETSCWVDLTYFPFDLQTCHINITNWSFSSNSVNFTTTGKVVNLRYYKENAEWHLLGACMGRSSVPTVEDPQGAPLVYFTVVMQRRPIFYVLNILVPCTAMTLASVLVFVLPCDSGEKVSLAISVLLSYTVLMVIVSDFMPKSSDSIAILAAFLTVNVMLTTLSLLLTVVTLNLHSRSPFTPMPRVIKMVFLKGLATLLLMPPWTPAEAESAETKAGCADVRIESMVDDVFADSPKSVKLSEFSASKSDNAHDGNQVLVEKERRERAQATRDSWRVEEAAFVNDWKRLSSVVDRLFFLLYTLTAVVVCVAMLGSICRSGIESHGC